MREHVLSDRAQVFCYLRMGGSLSRVTVLPLLERSSSSEALIEAKASFATFDVKRAHCTRPEDERRFLTCIDAGFGSHEPFSALVRAPLSLPYFSLPEGEAGLV